MKRLISSLVAMVITIGIVMSMGANVVFAGKGQYYDDFKTNHNKFKTNDGDWTDVLEINTDSSQYNDKNDNRNAYYLVRQALLSTGTEGECLGFVRSCYNNAFVEKVGSACCATKYSKTHIESTDMSVMPIGAIVLFDKGSSVTCSTCHNNAGHIGIYIGKDSDGNQLMVHLYSGICQISKISTVEGHKYHLVGWGWYNNQPLSYTNPHTDPTKYVTNETELLNALNGAQAGSELVNIQLRNDITIDLAAYADQYPQIIKLMSEVFEYRELGLTRSVYEPVNLSIDNSQYYTLLITNANIKGAYKISVDGNVEVDYGSSVSGIKPIDLRTSRADVVEKNVYLEATKGISNYGYVNGCKANYVSNYCGGRINFAYGIRGLCNDGYISWVYDCNGVNYGEVQYWVASTTTTKRLLNYGYVDTLMTTAQCYTISQKFGTNSSTTGNHLQIGGYINDNKISGTALRAYGGSIGKGSYYHIKSYDIAPVTIVYSITVKGLNWDKESGFKDVTSEQATALGLFEGRSYASYSWYSPDGKGNITYIFTEKTNQMPEKNLFNRLLKNITFASIVYFDDYDFNIYENISIDTDLVADFALKLNGRKVTFEGDISQLSKHAEFENGIVNIVTPVKVASPNTLIFEDVDIIVDESVEGSPFICDNGRIVFDNCSNSGTDPIEIKLSTTTDSVEINDDRVRSVGFVEGDEAYEGDDDFVIRYGESVNGLTSVENANGQSTTEKAIYASLANALGTGRTGEFTVMTDATVGDLAVPGNIVLKVSDDQTITVENKVTNDGAIGGTGTIVVKDEDKVINNGEIEKDVNIEIEPTPTPAPTPSQPVNDEGVIGFCTRLYTCALGRASDPQGVQNWADAIKSGADGAQAARGFFFSPEFTGKNLDNTEYVKRLYTTFMDREADPAGLQAWVKALDNGATREKVFDGFVNSVEWANVCHKYGIKSGGTAAPTLRIEPNDKILAFTERLYTTCLGRAADPSGLKAWAEALANREGSGAKVASGFFFSPEFTNKNLDNTEYVKTLYRTFMDREADPAGLQAWVKALDEGATREKVFDGFTMSPEFGALCEKAGIQPY
ncbi:MAG: DUF4214 domain-containing protein [Saccharofermentans sp.]|nr:DUF4214 domain-containing protein [Saccharofermentans sp.]